MEEHPEGREIKYTLRIREKVRDRLAEVAKRHRRSLHNEALVAIERHIIAGEREREQER